MTAALPKPSGEGMEQPPLGIQIDWRDLYEESQRSLLALSFIAGWLIVLDSARQGQIVTGQLVAALLLMLGSAASLITMARRPRLSRYLLAGAVALAYLAMVSAYPTSAWPYVGPLILIACYGMLSSSEHIGFALALIAGLLGLRAGLLAETLPWSTASMAVGLLVGGAACSWISRRPLILALVWASQSISRALELTTALQQRQLELNRTLRAMDEANERLAMMNRRLAEAREQAEEARRAKSRFAASISHELRTPLNLIVGFTQVMYTTPEAYQGVVLSPAFLVDLGVVYRNAQHLQRLVDDVLDLSELEMGHMAIQPEPTDMVSLVREALTIVEGLVRLRSLELIAELDTEMPPAYLDRTRIKQVLLNLLSNAARYTEQGRITVRLFRRDDWAICEVTDTGPGIRPEDQARLFQEFERLPHSDSRNRGAGLGLAISKRFVQAHGGEIWVHSVPGQGSTFGFQLPLMHQATVYDVSHKRAPVTPKPKERPPVVVWVQSLAAGRLFSRYMEKHRAIVTHDRATALQHVNTLQAKAILVDAALGDEALDELAAELNHNEQRGLVTRPYLLSAPMPSDERRRIAPSVRGYLAKPILREELLNVLRAQGEGVQNVLLVDDDEDLLRLLSHYLQDTARPYRVTTARNGREALQCLAERRVDLILLDLVMPVMDGYRLLEELQHQGNDVPVVIISGQDALQPQEPLAGEVRLWLMEPVNAERLVGSLDMLLSTLSRLTALAPPMADRPELPMPSTARRP
ncbi:MAG: response regulator [Chloroflexi bacterium]|nr:response regulator [Chloroflexota bacterium]